MSVDNNNDVFGARMKREKYVRVCPCVGQVVPPMTNRPCCHRAPSVPQKQKTLIIVGLRCVIVASTASIRRAPFSTTAPTASPAAVYSILSERRKCSLFEKSEVRSSSCHDSRIPTANPPWQVSRCNTSYYRSHPPCLTLARGCW